MSTVTVNDVEKNALDVLSCRLLETNTARTLLKKTNAARIV